MTRWVSDKKQELFTLREQLSSPPGFWWGPCCFLIFFLNSFCIVLLCVFTFWVPCCDARYDFPIKRCLFRLYLQLFVGVACLIYVIYDCLRKLVSNTYCVVFLLCFSLSCVPYVASFSGLSVVFLLPLRYSETFM